MTTDPSGQNHNHAHFDKELALAKFYDSAPMMMGVCDLINNDIKVISCNVAAGNLLGKKTEDIEGRFASQVGLTNEDINKWVENFRKAESTGMPHHFDYLKYENYFSVSVSYMGKSDEGDPRFSFIGQNITEERLSKIELYKTNLLLEEKIKERTEQFIVEKRRLDSLLRAAPVGITFIDRELRYQIINELLAEINGKSVEEHINEKVENIIPGYMRGVTKVLQDVLRTGKKISNFEFQLFPENDPDHLHYFASNYFPVIVENKIIGVGATVIDITKMKNSENALRGSESQLKLIANAMPQIVWSSGPEGELDWYNDWWYEYTGLEKGSNWDDTGLNPVHPEDLETLMKTWQHSLKTGIDYQVEVRVKRKSDNQYRWHLIRAVPVKDVSGKIFKWIGSSTDIHDQKKLVQELQEEKNLRENFIATLGHDLRTPLTSARIAAELILKKAKDTESVSNSARKIVINLERADSMIRDLLDVTRIRAGENISLTFEQCNLNQIAQETVNDLNAIHGERFVMNADKEINGYWSSSAIRRILENLGNNAAKYGSPDTPISIDIELKNNLTVIKVHNFGNPISPEEQNILFQPFKRSESTHTKQKGWGLGLTLVKGLVEAQNGYVEVESSMEEGTTFLISLPLNIGDGRR